MPGMGVSNGIFGAGEQPAAQLPATTWFPSPSVALPTNLVPEVPMPVTPAPTWRNPAIVPMTGQSEGTCSVLGQDCRSTQCCSDAGRQCYQKNQWWAECKKACTPGIHPTDEPQYRQPWACRPLGSRNNAGTGSGWAPFLGSASTSRRLIALAIAAILVVSLGIAWLWRTFTAPKNGMVGSKGCQDMRLQCTPDMRLQCTPYNSSVNSVWHTNQQFMQTSPNLVQSPSFAQSPVSSVMRHPFVGVAMMRNKWQSIPGTLPA